MDNIVNKLFEAGLLSEEDKQSLQAGFESHVQEAAQALAEVQAKVIAEKAIAEGVAAGVAAGVEEATVQIRETVETQIREEMAQRFEHDKSTLVEAMDRMLTDVVQKIETERASELNRLRESRTRYDAAVKEARGTYKTRIQEHAKTLESFILRKLTSELTEFNEDKNAVAEMRVKLAAQLAEGKDAYKVRMKEHMNLMRSFVMEKLAAELGELRKQETALAEKQETLTLESLAHRNALEEAYADRLKKVDEFVVRQVSSELREFQEDKRALVEKRVQLVAESRKKLAETQRKFVAEAAKMVDAQVTETLKVELTQLHEDLEKNRQNMFGRRIFEAVAAEFMTSYFGEDTEVRKVETVLESTKAELATLKKQLAESQKQADVASRKAKLAEETANRTKIMAELTGNLSRDKKAVMEELLETVKTTQLREAFTKYLPAVLNEGSKKQAPQSRQRTLTEAPVKELSTVAITGDQRTNRLLETVQAEGSDEVAVNNEAATILRLAGIKK
jgi:hypothetical protein